MIVSVIIPAFNAEEHIVECVGSALLPSGVGEVIVVDDGSVDNTVGVLRESFGKNIEDGSLKLICQRNSGVSAARNAALNLASGDYVAFLDADDYFFSDYYKKIFDLIDSVSPDLIEIGFRRFGEGVDNNRAPIEFVCSPDDGLSAFESACVAGAWYAWCRVVKRSILPLHKFDESIRYCEDMVFLVDVYRSAKSVARVNEALYAYRQHSSSACQNQKPEYIDGLLLFLSRNSVSGVRSFNNVIVDSLYNVCRVNNSLESPYRFTFKQLGVNFLKGFLAALWQKKVRVRNTLFAIIPPPVSRFVYKILF
ncbi:glycosyltransferase family 2 protein [Uliginosibacterium paludis]|uniref:Glycosyltransferase family 2 protein n=1 Tax=Uliginosibacterium paludis TaxID=1615952 RepID=A0ABV2CUW6_9RHOO